MPIETRPGVPLTPATVRMGGNQWNRKGEEELQRSVTSAIMLVISCEASASVFNIETYM
jgi:hypothetical protein